MSLKDMPGLVKIAILVKILGRNVYKQFGDIFDEYEKEKIDVLVSEMGSIQPEVAEDVAKEFTRMVVKEKNAKPKSPEQKLDVLKSMDSEQLGYLIKNEHPQTIAIIIAHLDQNVASEVMTNLPDEIKADVAYRIAKLDKIVSGMLEEINSVFKNILKDNKSNATRETNGKDMLAGLLNQADGAVGGMILDELEERDPELVDEIRQMMFVFEDLVLVDDKGLQSVMRSVDIQELALSLKAASEDVKEKIFKNMSERASIMLKEEIELLGAVRMKDVSDAQRTITKIIQDKENKGELVISGRGGDEFIG